MCLKFRRHKCNDCGSWGEMLWGGKNIHVKKLTAYDKNKRHIKIFCTRTGEENNKNNDNNKNKTITIK